MIKDKFFKNPMEYKEDYNQTFTNESNFGIIIHKELMWLNK